MELISLTLGSLLHTPRPFLDHVIWSETYLTLLNAALWVMNHPLRITDFSAKYSMRHLLRTGTLFSLFWTRLRVPLAPKRRDQQSLERVLEQGNYKLILSWSKITSTNLQLGDFLSLKWCFVFNSFQMWFCTPTSPSHPASPLRAFCTDTSSIQSIPWQGPWTWQFELCCVKK